MYAYQQYIEEKQEKREKKRERKKERKFVNLAYLYGGTEMTCAFFFFFFYLSRSHE